MATVRTVGELKAYLDVLEPTARLTIKAVGRDPKSDPDEDIRLSIEPVSVSGIELKCNIDMGYNVLEISNADPDDMEFNQY